MNLGQTDEAKTLFEQSVDKAKRYKDVKRDNWRTVLDALDRFRESKSEHFVVRMHPSEAPVMEGYLLPLLEEAWKTLSAKYGFTPESPVLVDAFNQSNDFSVRSIGVPGLPALGVCFGGVITLLGPTAMPVGAFSWSRTAWHEFAHVITLQLSKGQVPRWLTEGLSVYEEKARRPEWGREMQKQLFDRYENGRLLKMDAINRAFRGPDIMFAYFQGGLIAEELTASRGFEVIPKMLKEFAKDRTTAQVFHDVLGIELADYDRQFEAYVKGLVGSYKMVPTWDDESLAEFQTRVKADDKDADAWTKLGWAQLQRGRSIDAGAALGQARKLAPKSPDVVLLEGRLAEVNERADLAATAYESFLDLGGDDLRARLFLARREIEKGSDTAKAVAHLEAAQACFPLYTGKDNPYLQLAKLYRGAGDMEKAVHELEAFAAISAEDYDVRKELKSWYLQQKDWAKVARVSSEMIDISPFGSNRLDQPDLSLHADYADALLELGRKDEAVRELKAQVALLSGLPEEARREANAVRTHVRLGQLLLDGRDALGALEQAVAALRLVPDDADALMLKAQAEEAAGYR
jgi:tetratricopeptide (TPR) repeat protein